MGGFFINIRQENRASTVYFVVRGWEGQEKIVRKWGKPTLGDRAGGGVNLDLGTLSSEEESQERQRRGVKYAQHGQDVGPADAALPEPVLAGSRAANL